jgi:hypothetical protein
MDSQLAANTARLDEYGMTLVSKRLKVSNETVDATGSTLWCAISCGKEQLAWVDRKGCHFEPECWDYHLLATVPDSPLLFRLSSFLCCSGVRSL